MKFIICIVGRSGSGKTTLLDSFLNDKDLMEKYPNVKRFVYSTTRGKRIGEEDGVDYNFTTEEEYSKINKDNMIESREYETKTDGKVHYFTTVKDFETDDMNVGFLCASSIHQTISYVNAYKLEQVSVKPIVIRLLADPEDRIGMLMSRCTTDDQRREVSRRVRDEDEEFSYFGTLAMNSEIRIYDFINCYNEESLETNKKHLASIIDIAGLEYP